MEKLKNNFEIKSHKEITLNGSVVEVTCSNPSITEEVVLKALKSVKFQDWLRKLDLREHELKSLEIRDVFMFGSNNVGFICVNSGLYPKKTEDGRQGHKIPGYVFIRGEAVSILVIIIEKETNKKYVLMVKQFRTPFGGHTYEFPAGMMDDEKNFKGQAATELQEEAGVEIHPEDLKELLRYGPSLGGCDEILTTYYCEIFRTSQQIKEMEAKIYGLQDHGEVIHLKLVEFDIKKILELNTVHPSSTMASLFAYQNLVKGSLQSGYLNPVLQPEI